MIKKHKRRLLLVADSRLAKFYSAEDFEIKGLVKEVSSDDSNIHHHRQEKTDGRFGKSGSNPRFFDPHSEAKDLDRKDFCKIVTQEVLKFFDDSRKDRYDQLILVCGPKMLGDLRDDFSHHAHLTHIDIQECVKELIHDNTMHYSIKQLEDKVLKVLKFK
jgi:protein required for attachment to host cells